MTGSLHELLAALPPVDDLVDARAAAAVRERASQTLRPGGALAALDDIAVHLAGWRGTERPAVNRPAVLLFAADHGVAAAGVSNYPAEITSSMLAAVEEGRATVNAMAAAVGAAELSPS